jgi:hypothetical protein
VPLGYSRGDGLLDYADRDFEVPDPCRRRGGSARGFRDASARVRAVEGGLDAPLSRRSIRVRGVPGYLIATSLSAARPLESRTSPWRYDEA